MSNNKSKIQFKQSLFDFPMSVSLGRKMPEWSLKRWKENQGLRFVPYDDEGFTLRGDRRQLLYKGQRRSHRFTILGDGAFEYDCILLKEPESNVISLRMEGAENFDFFRQPDFVPDPFLKGSYAVYLKDIFVGQGTGKLCHIHRPLIIDALGRKCWGVLSVVGNELRITIPEEWLISAKYPVVVDPTVGTTTVGSQNTLPGNSQTFFFNMMTAANRYYIQNAIPKGMICEASYICYQGDNNSGGYPVLFHEDYYSPLETIFIDADRVNLNPVSSTPHWKTANFTMQDYMFANGYMWFGISTDTTWYPLFDYGGLCFYNLNSTFTDFHFPFSSPSLDIKLSMYFTFPDPINYTRQISQNVNSIDSRKTVSDYKRAAIQTVDGTAGITKFTGFIRNIKETQTITDTIKKCIDFFRGLYIEAGNMAETTHKAEYNRIESDTVKAEGSLLRHLFIFVKLVSTSFVRDFMLRRFLISREEIVLKSCITRELTLESKIN